MQELAAIPADDAGAAAWPGRLLWAEGLEEGRRLLLAERLWRAASALMRRSRWQHAAQHDILPNAMPLRRESALLRLRIPST
jgi:hypothetical protein